MNTSLWELKERMKELSCLYKISAIIHESKTVDADFFERLLLPISEGLLFPKLINVIIQYENVVYTLNKIGSPFLELSEQIIVENKIRGTISLQYEKNEEVRFLSEEETLLKKIAIEIADAIERFDKAEEQKRIQKELDKTEKLSTLGEISASIAHELNTPIGNILGYAEYIKFNTNDVKVASDADKIISSSIHAREIIKKLMYFACEMPHHFQKQNINNTITSAIDLVYPKLNAGNVELKLSLDENCPLIKADNLQLTQVVFNLVLNALKAMPEGGDLSITTSFDLENCYLTFIDSGKGIPKENYDKIFSPFFTTSPKGEGTGLGLSVVHGIVKNHRGNISVISKLGVYTKFKISFPIPAADDK